MTPDDDVAWARAVLGRANPVPSANPANRGPIAAPYPVAAARSVARHRARRRAVTVGALASAAALVAAVGATVALAGGGGHGAPAGTHAVFAAAATTEAARTADISLSVTTGATSLSGQGVADLATGDADFTVDLPASLGQVEVRSVGGTVYVQVPPGFSSLAGGKAWASFAAPTANAGTPSSFDATWLIDWLRGIAGPVTTVGTGDTVHGDPTTHYRATIDLSKVAPGAPAGLQPLTSQSVPVDVWVDGAGRLRRLTASVDASGASGASGASVPGLGTVQVNAELWGFGTPVEVAAPPADQVGDASALVPGARQLLPGLAGLAGL
jgi:hypothetical protein